MASLRHDIISNTSCATRTCRRGGAILVAPKDIQSEMRYRDTCAHRAICICATSTDTTVCGARHLARCISSRSSLSTMQTTVQMSPLANFDDTVRWRCIVAPLAILQHAQPRLTESIAAIACQFLSRICLPFLVTPCAQYKAANSPLRTSLSTHSGLIHIYQSTRSYRLPALSKPSSSHPLS